MTKRTLSRRQFLRSTTRIGVTLTLAASLYPTHRPAMAQESSPILISQGTDMLGELDVQNWIVSGLGGLWVSGQFLNSFARNLDYNNLPPLLKDKYRLAGGESKSLPAARAIWLTIPAPIRAGGPEALWKFHQGKDWSHIIPKAWGGAAVAENGVWWCSPCNKSLGPRPMHPALVEQARLILHFEAIRFAIIQTIKGMVRGGMVGVVAGGLLACLDCGLQYAEGKITWGEMVSKIVTSSIVAGSLGFTITGILVGIALAFPFLIPIFAPFLIVLQAIGLVFLGHQVIQLVKGWWKALDVEKGLETIGEVLKNVGGNLRNLYEYAEENVLNVVWDWVVSMADRVGVDRAWEMAVEFVQGLGLDKALVWFKSQTKAVTSRTADLMSALSSWEYLPDVDAGVNDVRESIASVVASEFQDAISTTEGLLNSIGDYRKNANLNADNSILAA